MNKLKSLLVGLILLTVTLLLAAFSWMWQHNSTSINPLPIPADSSDLSLSANNQKAADGLIIADSPPVSALATLLQVCADRHIQPALDNIITKFERRYSHLNVLVTYTDKSPSLQHCSANKPDMVLFAKPIATKTLASLQAGSNSLESGISNTSHSKTAPTGASNKIISDSAPLIQPFNYTLEQQQPFTGVLLTGETDAVSLRNYLLSSMSQDIFVQFGYDNIDGYDNQVDDLFNTKRGSKTSAQ